MPTTPIHRLRTVVEGVAGAPYYMNMYFEVLEGALDTAIDRWHNFCIPDDEQGPSGSTWTTEGEVAVIDPATGSIIEIQNGTPQTTVGTQTVELLPPATQLLVRWRTGVYQGGREVRGRTFMPCQFEANSNAGGRPAGSHTAATQARAQTMIDATGVAPVIWSRTKGLWEEITSTSVWSEWAVQRSRRD